MEAILLVGHGSRDAEGNEELLQFARNVSRRVPDVHVETCFLEFAKPTVQQGIDRCVEAGAARIVLVPIILFAAGHAKIHIPMEIDRAKQKHPDIAFAYGRSIGIHEKVLEILQARLEEAGYSNSGEPSERDRDTAVLLLGRGSSDGDANGDFFKMTRLLWERLPVKWVESSFIGVTEPSFPEGLERCRQLGAKNIYVLPYFLFTGILIKRIEQMTAEFSRMHPELRVELARYFGFHPQLVELLLDRVTEAVEGRAAMNCDMCKYRKEASHGHDHHHHHDHDHHHHDHDHHDHDHHDHDHDHGHDHPHPAKEREAVT
ncbi:sirohydrochlorin chelatase [Paenibacillus alkalitolerans]|uniref:sirohydrochlorin chelatase n=1 Tax=Paenibacillus alkalitolerans TaxID=2799335 RepID=UPI0018F524A1|nr:sirohydrochlorin chelatase [Paenibacillus alkalitolerans]